MHIGSEGKVNILIEKFWKTVTMLQYELEGTREKNWNIKRERRYNFDFFDGNVVELYFRS